MINNLSKNDLISSFAVNIHEAKTNLFLLALRYSLKSVVIELLRLEPKFIYIKDGLGLSAIHIAAAYCDSDMINTLLEIEPKLINSRSKIGNTPLYSAVIANKPANYLTLITFDKSTISYINKDKETPLNLAIKLDLKPLVKILIASNYKLSEIDGLELLKWTIKFG